MADLKQSKGKVIITSGRSFMALSIARSLGKKGIEVIGTECVKMSMLTFSKYVGVNEVHADYMNEPEQFIIDLLKIVKKHKPTGNTPYVLMPSFTETLIISKHKDKFNPYITVACPDYEQIMKVHPKHHLTRTANQLNIHIPSTFHPKNDEELKKKASEMNFPVLLKPYDLSGGRGIIEAADKTGLQKAYHKHIKHYHTPPLIQEYVEGEEYCLAVLYHEGQLKASMAYKNLQRFPKRSSSSVVRETIDSAPFIEDANTLFGAIKWTGIAEIDFLWDGVAGHKPHLIEVNPRFWAALFLAIHSGIDFPWLNYLLFSTGEVPNPGEAIIGDKTKLPFVWILSSIQESIRSDKDFNDIKTAGYEAIQKLKEGKAGDAFNHMVKEIKNNMHLKDKLNTISKILNETKGAENELFRKDDPYSGLGFLYIFAYLIKHHQLPPELGL